MSLAAPLFLIGLLALALPLWLHRQRARHQRPQPFSSAMLLERHDSRLRVRRRWRDIGLLALRLALLAALCCAFAQPLWQRRAAAQRAASLQLIVLDTSLSMGAQGHFERARAEAERIIDALGPGQRAELVSASDVLAPMSGAASAPSDNAAALRAVLATLKPSAARLDYHSVMAGLDALSGRERGGIDVHFISDFQASGAPPRFADLLPSLAPRRTLTVQLHRIGLTVAEANWAVIGIARSGPDILATVRGFNTPAAVLEVALEVNGREVGRVAEHIGAAGEAQFRFRQPLLRIGDNRIIARLLNRDALAADNVHWAVIRNVPRESVPLLTTQPNGRAAKYLATALAASDGSYAADVQPLASFDTRGLPRYRWVLLDDLGALEGGQAAQLRDFVANGGALFTALGARAAELPRLPLLGDTLAGSAADTSAPLSVGQIDASHPVLVGLAGWDALEITHLRVLVPQSADRVLVSASSGAPLLLERRVNRGRVLIYTSDLNADGNDLPLQPLFVGFMAQVGRYLGGRGEIPTTETVGARLTLGRDGRPAGQLIDPQGREVLSLADTSRALTVKFDQSGFYQLYTPAAESLVAVNPDPLESDLAPMPAAQLARWSRALAALGAASSAAGVPVTGSALVALAPLLLGLTVLLVLAESMLGNHLLPRAKPQGQSR